MFVSLRQDVMPANKYALLRYRIIDRCIRNPHRPYPSKEDLRMACEEALYGSDGERISTSTIDKDLWAMRNEGQLGYYAPIAFSKLERGYFYEDPEYTIAELPLNDDDLEAIRTAAETLYQFKDIPLFSHFDSAIEKILDRMKIDTGESESESEREVIQFEKANKYVGGEYLKLLYESAKDKRVVHFAYSKFGDSGNREVKLEALLIKEYHGRWYVIGWDQDRESIRTYSLDRMEKLRTSEASFSRSHRFNVDRFFKHAIGITVKEEEPIKVVLRFKDRLAPYIITQPIHHTQKVIEERKDGVDVSIEVLDTPELISTILGYGEQVEIVAPESFRSKVMGTLRECLNSYLESS